MDINIQFSEQDWQRIDRDWSAWWLLCQLYITPQGAQTITCELGGQGFPFTI